MSSDSYKKSFSFFHSRLLVASPIPPDLPNLISIFSLMSIGGAANLPYLISIFSLEAIGGTANTSRPT